MAFAFPMAVADFLDLLPIKSLSLECPEVSEVSRTSGGELIPANIGTRLWQGEVKLGRIRRQKAREIEALIDVMRASGASFMAYRTTSPFPAADPDGSLLGAATPQIKALSNDARIIQLKGLPAGYTLTRGDELSFSYRTDPVRFALHRVAEVSVTATGAGETAFFQVTPNLRPGAAVDAAVQLIKPQCKAMIVPGSVRPGHTNRFITDGMNFDFMQTLR